MDDSDTGDIRLARLYDYTKFHIGIYLSAAAGVATLLGSRDAGWVIATLVGNQYLLYLAFASLMLAGMCGGIVATGITESLTYKDFWTGDHHPATFPKIEAKGKKWVAREHGFFWASLLLLAASILIRYPGPASLNNEPELAPGVPCCCICQQQREAAQ